MIFIRKHFRLLQSVWFLHTLIVIALAMLLFYRIVLELWGVEREWHRILTDPEGIFGRNRSLCRGKKERAGYALGDL